MAQIRADARTGVGRRTQIHSIFHGGQVPVLSTELSSGGRPDE